MDFIRRTYKTRMKLSNNSDVLTPVRWFRAAPGAKLFPRPHFFSSIDWDGLKASDPESRAWTGLGEQDGEPRTFWTGSNVNAVPGTNFCGAPELFLRGRTVGVDPTWVTDANGLSACCLLPTLQPQGGQAQGGTAWRRVGVAVGRGGERQAGSGGILVGLLLAAAGGEAQAGSGGILVGLLLAGAGGQVQGGEGIVASIEVTTETGVPDFLGIATLELDSQAGTLSQPAAGRARYILRPYEDASRVLCDRAFNRAPPPLPLDPDASPSDRGYVNTVQQFFAGLKIFNDGVAGQKGVSAAGTLGVSDGPSGFNAIIQATGSYDWSTPLPQPIGTPNPFLDATNSGVWSFVPTLKPGPLDYRFYLGMKSASGAPSGPYLRAFGGPLAGEPVLVVKAGGLFVDDGTSITTVNLAGTPPGDAGMILSGDVFSR